MKNNTFSQLLRHRTTLIALSSVFAIALFAGIFYFTKPFVSGDYKEKAGKMSKLQEIEEYYKMEFQKTADLSLGYIPTERLLVAKAQMDRQNRERQRLRTAAVGLNWTERGPNNIGGRTRAVIFDKNDGTNKKVWASSVGGGLWNTNDITAGSPTWNKVDDFFDNIAITSIAQEPSSPQYMYFGTGEGWYNVDAIRGLGIWRSSNSGSSWSQLAGTNNSNFHYVNKIIATTDGHLYAATRAGLYKSTDHGDNWTQVLAGVYADVEVCADKSIVASTGSAFDAGTISISKFTTHGANTGNSGNWTAITPAGTVYRIELAVAPSDANRIYALGMNASSQCGFIWESTDQGTAWTTRTVPTVHNQGNGGNFAASQAWYNFIAAVDPNNANTLYVAGLDMCRSTDEGANWVQISTWSTFNGGTAPAPWPRGYVHADHHAITFAPGSSTTAVLGNDGGVYYSTTMNTAVTSSPVSMPSFSAKNTGFNVTQYYAADIAPTACTEGYIAGAQDNGTQRLTTAGIGSGSTVTGGDGAYSHIDQDNSSIQISAYTRNQYTYTYNNWSTSFFQSVSGSTGVFINPTEYDDVNNILYTSFGSGTYKAISGGVLAGSGSTLPTHTSKTGITGTPAALKVDPNNSNVLWIGSAGGTLNKVTNPNATNTVELKPSSSFFGGNISSIDVERGNSNHILVTVSNYGSATSVQESTDGGATWTNLDNASLPDMPIRWGIFNPVNPDQIFLATEMGVWSTDNIDGAATVWQSENTGLANVRVDMLQYRSSDYTLVAATHGRGIYTTQLTQNAPLSTAVIERTVQTSQGYLGPNATVYFYSKSDGQLIAKIQNNSSHDYGCTTVAIGRGSDGSMTPVHFRDNTNANDVMPKTVTVTPTSNNTSGNYTITLYYTPAEISAWTTHTGKTWSNAALLKCSGDVNLVTPTSPNAGGTLTAVTQTGNSSTGLGFIAATVTTGFSSFAIGSVSSVLPVEITDLKGKWYNQAAWLNWNVVNQQLIEAYDVERSTDGQTFRYVATVKANNQSNAAYQFEDKTPESAATLYYRLKIKDYSSSRSDYSKTIAIQIPNKGFNVKLMQNPVQNQLQISFDEAQNYPLSNLNIQITDMAGRVVLQRSWQSWDDRLLSLPIQNLSNGIYVLNLQTASGKKAIKFVKN